MPRKKKIQSADALAIGPTPGAREERISGILKDMEKLFGKGSLSTLKGKYATREISKGVIPTGSLGLDHALGIGGLPKGRIVEIYGPEAGGKTTLCLHFVHEMQKAGGIAAFVDAEHALTPQYAEDIGVDLERLLFAQPGCGEDALNLVETLCKSGKVDLIVVDSVSALVPRVEVEGEVGDIRPGAQARMMSQALRKLVSIAAGTDTTVVFINQIRYKIGGYGNPETTSGGNALKFYTSVRIDIRRIGSIKKKEEIVGNRVKAKVVKNKMAPPFRVAEFDIIFGVGISSDTELLDYGTAAGVLEKAGSWYSFKGERIGQGRDTVLGWLNDNPKEKSEVEKVVRAYLNGEVGGE